jgi:hypothetical protein
MIRKEKLVIQHAVKISYYLHPTYQTEGEKGYYRLRCQASALMISMLTQALRNRTERSVYTVF